MITLARLDGSKLTVNADLIEFVESTPDTVVSLVSGRRLIVKEPVAEVVERVIEYRRRILAGLVCHGLDYPLTGERSDG